MRLILVIILLWTTACEHGEISKIETGGRPKYMGIPLRHCGNLYDNDMHKAWAECMGVGYE